MNVHNGIQIILRTLNALYTQKYNQKYCILSNIFFLKNV